MRAKRPVRLGATVLVISALLTASFLPQDGRAAHTTLTYSVEPAVYNNTVRAGSVTDMLIPHIVAARDPLNVSRENVYIIGMPVPGFGNTTSGGCYNLTVLRSTDAGRSFGPPLDSYCGLYGSDLGVAAAEDGTLFVSGGAVNGTTVQTAVLRSQNAGATWTAVREFPGTWGTSFLAYDAPADDLYLLLWDGSGWANSLLVSVSHDHGASWSAPAGPSFPQTVMFPQLAAWNGHLVLTFTAMVESGNQSAGEYLATVSSADGGATWSPATRLTPIGVAYCQYSGLFPAVSSDGTFAAAWYADTLNGSQIDCSRIGFGSNTTVAYVRTSADGGLTWASPIEAGGPPGNTEAIGGRPVAFDDRGRLFIAWKSIDPWAWNVTIHVAVSDRSLQRFNTSTFSTRFEAQGGNATMTEGLSAGPSGRVYLAWESYNGTYAWDPAQGIYVRSVSGRAQGNIRGNGTDAEAGTELELRDAATGAVRQSILWNGTSIDLAGLPPDSYAVWVSTVGGMSYAGSLPILVWGQTTFTVFGGAPFAPPEGRFPWEYVALAAVASGAAASAYAYTRLGHEDVLQRKVRLLMFEYVKGHPGASYSQVRNALGLRNGTAAYHLGVLVRQGFLHTESRRHRRWYYPNGNASLWKDVPLSPLQASILEAVQNEPGIGVRELSRATDGRISSVADNVKALAREGALRTTRTRGRVHCYPVEPLVK